MSAAVWVSQPVIDVCLIGPQGQEEACFGLIDTGASVVCADRRISKKLGLIASNRTSLQIADGSEVWATVYRGRLRVPELSFDAPIELYAVEMAVPSTRILLGRSFLSNYNVTYMGRERMFHWYRHSAYAFESDDDYAT